MTKIVIGNSYSKVEGWSAVEEKALRKALSYTTPSHNGGFSRPSYLIDKQGRFPTGLLYLVKSTLRGLGGSWAHSDTRIVPRPQIQLFRLQLPFKPYPEQIEAANAIWKAHRGIVCAVTGFGKSAVIALIIQKLQVRTLIVVPNLGLKYQLIHDFIAWFGKDKIGKNKDIWIENIDALDTKNKLIGYDCVICDEVHHSAASTYRKLNKQTWVDVYHRVGLTATPFRSQDHEKLLFESFLSEVVYEIRYQKAVEKGYVVPLDAFYIEIPKVKTKGVTWSQVYKELVTDRKDRNSLLINLAHNLRKSGKSALFLVKEITHGRILSDNGEFSFANGADGGGNYMINTFGDGGFRVLIGTNGVCGEGRDTKACEYVLICGLGKSKNQFMQQVGRALRKFSNKISAKVIIIKDKSHKFTLRHFNAQVKILKEEYGIVPVKLEV